MGLLPADFSVTDWVDARPLNRLLAENAPAQSAAQPEALRA